MPNMLLDTQTLLDTAYRDLGFDEGDLISVCSAPTASVAEHWLDKGEWLEIARSVNSDKVFFVGDNPVAVFAKCDSVDEAQIRRFVNRIWCMSRPGLLFLATPGELSVLDLSKPPVAPGEQLDAHKRVLKVARSIRDVQRKLKDFQAEEVKSGRAFEGSGLGPSKFRAGEALIRDLRAVRNSLIKDMDLSNVHALIGRSIFIRYLEDRHILDKTYFDKIAQKSPKWQRLLATPLGLAFEDAEMESLLYPRVLSDKDFTYALFAQLAKDFNGDMLPSSAAEERKVSQAHLTRLQQFLIGAADDQLQLFFHAYRFDVIPMELISSIYEEFYKTKVGDKDKGTHYTPDSLVDFVLSQVLTSHVLKHRPRILDPACGSGIFLVKAYRRLIRYEMQVLGGKLEQQELRKILSEQIAGIDINKEAIGVAAFSLYLALLDCQEPRDILANPRLPNVVYHTRRERDPQQHFDILVHANAFAFADTTLDASVAKQFELDTSITERFGQESVDIVIGNPPWGSPGKADKDAREAMGLALKWRDLHSLETDDNEYSQLFIHKALDFLKPGGRAGMLVSSGVILKEREGTRTVRVPLRRDGGRIQISATVWKLGYTVYRPPRQPVLPLGPELKARVASSLLKS